MITQRTIDTTIEPTSRELGIADCPQVRIESDISGLEAFWKHALLPTASPFQTFAWNEAWYRRYREFYDEPLVVVAGAGRVLFPLYREGKVLRLAGDTVCDFQDAIGSCQRDVDYAFREIVGWARSRGYEFHFARLSTEGFLYRAIQSWEDNGWSRPVEKVVGPCPWLRLSGSAEESMGHLPRKFRAELRRQSRRIDADFPGCDFELWSAPQITAERLDEMVSFHKEQFRREGVNPLEDSRFIALLSDCSRQQETGFSLSRLGSEDSPLAMDLGFVRGGRFYGFLTIFDQQARRYSPGSCLLVRRIDRLIADHGVRIFDFLCGGEPYKYRFATGEYSVRAVSLFPKTLRGLRRRSRYSAGLWMRRVGKRCIAKVGMRT